MKDYREDIDTLIKETLTEQEARFYDQLDEPGLIGMLKESFKGKNSWLMIVMNIANLAVFGFLIYCIVKFFEVVDTRDMLIWACAGFLCFATMGMIKLYVWMQMDKQTIIREMKRLELQVMSLSSKLSN